MKTLFTVMLSIMLAGAFAQGADKAADTKSATIILTKDNTITLNDAFYSETVAELAVKAKDLDSRTDSSDPIYLVLNSPGGSIDAGLELIEILSSLKRPVKTISLFSASMGFQTVQGLGERIVMANGTLMSHKARGGFYGEFPGQLDSRYSYYLKRVNRMNEKAVERTNGKQTMKSYADLIENEYWCDGAECVKDGFADRVGTAQCDKSLTGIKQVTIDKFFYQGYLIEFKLDYDNCPLNSNYLAFHIYVDGEPLFQSEKDKKATASATTVQQAPKPFWDYSYEDEKPKKAGLTAEQLFEVQQKAKAIQEQRKNRMVIKGY